MNGFVTRQLALVIGLVIGLALGLLYTWVIDPLELVNTYPALLRTDYRQTWVRLAALSYVADGSLERARARLDGLKREDVDNAVQALIEDYAAAGRPADTLRSLTTLARALDVHTPAMLVYLYTPGAWQPTLARTLSLTPTPVPTHTRPSEASPSLTVPAPQPTYTPVPVAEAALPLPTPTLGSNGTPPPTPTIPLLSRLRLTEQELVCQPGQTVYIEVVVRDERGGGLPGVEVWLTWPGGADRAVTGLKPQKGAGYVDFNAEPGVSYALSVGGLGMPLVTDLRVEPCPAQEDKEPVLGSWRIVLEPRSSEVG